MKKIRIGNDVKLRIQLSYNGDYANIQNAKAFFVNATLKEKLEAEYKKRNRFVGRFPIEPFLNEFKPSAYNINSVGYPRYNVMVFNNYSGFGVNPDWKNAFPLKEMNITEYRAEIVHTSTPTVIEVLFPSDAQLYPGVYQLVIVAQIHEPGYKNNVRTITTNYNGLFELVTDSEDADVEERALIEINNESSEEPLQDIYAVAGSYNNNNIQIRRNDGGIINVDVTVPEWYENDN